MTKKQITKDFISFLSDSPTQFQAVETMRRILDNNNFTQLEEQDSWKLKKNGSYYCIRGGSAIVAFKMGKNSQPSIGIRMVGAHTDSPGLKIKSKPETRFKDYLSLGVEVYGSPILSTWFDRDLSIAGRVTYSTSRKKLATALIDFRDPIAKIPNLAIHLTQNRNEKVPINAQTELPPIILQEKKGKTDFKGLLKKQLKKFSPKLSVNEILGTDLWLYDVQKPAQVGLNGEFITGARLDNLLSCFAGVSSLVESKNKSTAILVCNDNEEVGSNSFTGAAGPFLASVLERLYPDKEEYHRLISNSILISADNGHGIHPNYRSLHDDNHGPILNQGPIIKINANQRYATNSETGAFFRNVCQQAKVPVQDFINRSDLACGTTIGPLTATALGIKTLDIGVAQFAMHSIRETCGADDIWYMVKALKECYQS
jgi:aspartyl aminopeptidase